MSIRYSFESVDMGDEIIAVPVGNGASEVGGVLKMNSEGNELFQLLELNYTEDMIIDELLTNYDNPRHEIESYVHGFVSTLRENGFVED